ncbi:MAG: uroporphyrinogen-III synthase [Steroidobacteraceae bacterium]
MSLIPFVMRPLRGLRVLVTRPLEQAEPLAALIEAQGGEARVLPSIAIEPVAPAQSYLEQRFDWVVFVSANAVRHGTPLCRAEMAAKVAAIGQATARALQAAAWRVDVVPSAPYTTETLLNSVEFTASANERVLIVRGMGGRDVLDRALLERGAAVESLTVYRRIPATYSAVERDQFEREWLESGFDIITATSAETLTHLHDQLSAAGRERLSQVPLLVVSPRIAESARALGLTGECVLAPSAEDASIVGTLAHWFARAR